MTSRAPADLSAGARLSIFGGTFIALLATPLVGFPAAIVVAVFAWYRRVSGLVTATVALLAAYSVWLAATTPI